MRDKQRRDPIVGSTGGGESNSPNSQPSEDPGAGHQEQKKIPQSGQQEEVNRIRQAESQVKIQSDQPDNGKFKVDSKEKELSRVKTGTRKVPE